MGDHNSKFEEELKLWTWLGHNLRGEACESLNNYEALKNHVKRALFADIELLVEQTGQYQPPINPEIVAAQRKIIAIEKAPLDTDALIVPCKGGFLMKINNTLPIVRQRFACAHETAHTYFFDLANDPPSKPYKRSTTRYWVEEGLCYDLARRILMPTDMIEKRAKDASPPYIGAFKDMMGTFLVSGELLAHRIRDLDTWDTLMLIFQNTEGAISLFKVLKSGDRLEDVHVARKGLKVTDQMLYQLLARAFQNELVEERDIELSVGSFERKVTYFGASYIGSHPPKVIALLSL